MLASYSSADFRDFLDRGWYTEGVEVGTMDSDIEGSLVGGRVSDDALLVACRRTYELMCIG